MNLENLEKIISKEPGFRLKQVRQVIFKDLIDDWSQAATLPLSLRQKLAKECPIGIEAKNFISKDRQTIRALIKLFDGIKIEAVLMRHSDRNTICVSSQAGCPLGCAFCVTGQSAFRRNLRTWEIVEQVLWFARLLAPKISDGGQARYLKKEGERASSIVFMGMGEPFLNYDNVLGAIKILNYKDCFGLGARHFSISTSGVIEGITKLADEPMEINLAVSLHAPNNELRSRLMPVNKIYPLAEVLKAIDSYIAKTHRRVMFEYILIKDLNDTDDCARQLAKIMNRSLVFVNLIPCNANNKFKRPSASRINKFREILERANIGVTQRYSFGQDIDAACGQLAGGLKQ